MKKRLLTGLSIIASLLLFTGCVNTADLTRTIQIQGTNTDYMTYDLQEWEELMSRLEVFEGYDNEAEIQIRDRIETEINKGTYVGEDRSYIYIPDVNSYKGKRAVECIAEYTGDGVYEVLEEASKLAGEVERESKIIDGTGNMLTRTVGDYSLIGIKEGAYVSLYMMHEPFVFKQQAEKDFISQFKTEGFLLKGFSQGGKESLIEITMPSFMIRNYSIHLSNATSYYQFFRDEHNTLTKTRMVINVYGEEGIYKEEFTPLQEAITYLGGAADLGEKIQNEVSEIIKDHSKGKVIRSGELKCTIKKHNGLEKNEQLIEIVIQ